MPMPRFSAATSLLLLGLVAVGAAEASLLALLILFTFILKLGLGVELGPGGLQFGQGGCCPPQVTLFNAATVASVLFTASCGLGAATWRFRRWKPGA